MEREPFSNYFNYFTEIEEHFQQARGTGMFLLSPLDWALIESWKIAGVPIEAVLRGIDGAFEKWRQKKSRSQMVNSLGWCTQAVMAEAQRMAEVGQRPAEKTPTPPFPPDDLKRYIEGNAKAVRMAGSGEFTEIADSLDEIARDLPVLSSDLESLEQHLTVLEQKMIAMARSRQNEQSAVAARRDMESQLRPWRSKMTAPQIQMLEIQFLERLTLSAAGLPRLSLFYLL